MKKYMKSSRASHGVLIAILALIPISSYADFTDNLDSYDTGRWQKSDGWTNGGMFNTGWKATHTTHSGGYMTHKTDNTSSSGKPYTSGELQSTATYGYGKYEVVMKAGKGSGIISSFFTYLGSPWDEIDVEIFGKDPTKMQANYFTNGIGAGVHETVVNLGFDASLAFHKYTFIWQAGKIRWYVDGCLKVTETGTRGPLPTHPGKIMTNIWPGTGVDGWTGHYTYTVPIYAVYDKISFTTDLTPPTGCGPAPTPTPTPVPTPIPNSPATVPSGMTASNNNGVVTLHWNDNSLNESGFQVMRRTGTTGNYSPIGTVGANVKVFTYTAGAPPTAGHYYTVQYFTSAGYYSALSNAAVIKPYVPPIIDTGTPILLKGTTSQ